MSCQRYRAYAPAQRAEVVEGYRTWDGTQAAYAASVGVPSSTLARWLVGPKPNVPRAATMKAPSMLEVVQVAPVDVQEDASPARSARLVLGGGVSLWNFALAVWQGSAGSPDSAVVSAALAFQFLT